MDHILLPSTIEFKDTDNPKIGILVLSPCHQGYGTTLGNALRRVLLSSIPGAAVEAVKIDGVDHEFSAIPGTLEDVVQVILNLKQLAVILHTDGPIKLSLKKKGVGDVTAADFETNADVQIINPELKIATITDAKIPFGIEVIIGKGMGYVTAAEKSSKNLDLGTMLMDSFYSAVRDVGYDVENTRVGDITDYEKLVVTIETNGTITPREAVNQATEILMKHFTSILETTK
ncbi:MAG: DNA-directed RNA polymerase subunit alpha [Candidatus Magasanikbacteria bacterium RIFCSPHIGHO2_12_FULL_41_16]|uniref:DNA-directed RNA polymerase subunit alpha n=1 Tax=Candidatus Magasanikbacteria bacterium RIFCSPLOWO2_01_FULL_40_15 TaxID=1798686 RepID=A0A1F6N243_9BACT|nr:MAG: DNA-directed RNA polymerase subunit alpha [Candidatus Magasanikbacteria bacterium RIFCSPHIGHO2_12_FULL_41_16]OGH77951.1 MAG: DNA-directed RNA polymerase subunit alpha [Candidatus Magasanikbacteria bacterium RIFCSPLOWO2_01_FULL_40_15]